MAKKFEYINFFPVETGVSEYLLASAVSSLSFSSAGPISLRFVGVCATPPGATPDFLADGVSAALLPPDADNRSNSPSAFPSRCGVGPIAARKGKGEEDWYPSP